jgi:hypothetical protein
MREGGIKRFLWFGADAEVGVGFGEGYSPFATYDVGGRQR